MSYVYRWRHRWLEQADRYLPEGPELDDAVWHHRHGIVLMILIGHLPVLFVWGLAAGHGVVHSGFDALPVVVCAVAACRFPGRFAASTMATIGLMSVSAVMVHLAGGLTEMHFSYFVMIGVAALYQRRAPLLIGAGFVVAQHTIMGMVSPSSVYGASAHVHQPLLWAVVHGIFILCAATTHIATWQFNVRQAKTDPLTGVCNRTELIERLDRLMRAAGSRQYGLVIVNLDRFRSLNEVHGSAAGDRVLAETARRLTQCAGIGATVGRLGADEFAVLFRVSSTHEAQLAADHLLRALREPLVLDGRVLLVTATLGVGFTADERTPQDCLYQADLAMTLAKARGGNQVEVYRRGIREARREHARLEADLARAIETGRIELYFQPVVDLVTGQIHGAEALARWFDPDRGAVSPAVFVPIAESSGLILALGDLVLERACEAAARLSRRVPGFVVNVNVSGQQLAEHNFPAGVRQTLRRTGCSPTALVLELTETAFVGDLDRADDRLRELRALGLRVAIDDFGTGYSSLSYLRRLPADVVKIDRSFVTAIGEGLEVLEAMMTLAHSMGLTVVAEGIETPDQLKALTRLRCDLGQGYLFAQPMSLLELTTLLDQPDPRPSWWTDGLGEPQLALWSPL